MRFLICFSLFVWRVMDAVEGQTYSDPAVDAHYDRRIYDTRGGWTGSKSCGGSTACMACSMGLPKFARTEKLAPVAVGSDLWEVPGKATACGMCFKVWMLPKPKDGRLVQKECFEDGFDKIATCPGRGDGSYIESAGEKWAWGAKVYEDEDLPYFFAIGVDWAAEGIKMPYGISYIMKEGEASSLGNWPVKVAVIPCPVGSNTLEYSFMDFGNENSNTYNKKLMIAGQRATISGVDFLLEDGEWYMGTRSGDGFWTTPPGIKHSPSKFLSVRIWCALNLQPTIEPELVPNDMYCGYQNPRCKRFVGRAQC